MRVTAVVQARMGSSRFPGKVLADLAGRPLLVHVIARAMATPGVDELVVATTTAAADDVLAALCRRIGVPVFRGSEPDVLDRFTQAARRHAPDAVMRVTADCPMLDPLVSGLVVARFREGDVDYASNVHPRTFPDGLDAEVFAVAALERAWREARLPAEREHVTPYLWSHPEMFRCANVAYGEDLSAHRWTVDEPRDLELVRALFRRLSEGGTPFFGMAEVLTLLEREPHLATPLAGRQS